MKRFICASLVFINLVSAVFAQTAAQEEFENLSNSSSGQEKILLPHEVGIYLKDYFPVGEMSDYVANFFGGGVSYVFHSPWYCPVPSFAQNVFGEKLNIGFSFRLDAEGGFVKDSVNSWVALNALFGSFLEWQINDWFVVQPSVEFDFLFDTVDSNRKASGTYFSYGLQLSPTFKFMPEKLRSLGLSLEAAPLWNITFEKENVVNYLGLRFGVLYRFSKKNSTAQENPVVQEEEEEVPVEEPPVEEEIQIEPTPEPEPEVEIKVEPEPEPAVIEPVEIPWEGKVSLNSEKTLIAPNGNEEFRNQKFSASVTETENLLGWTLEIKDSKKKTIRTITGETLESLSEIIWDGKDENGNIVKGKFSPVIKVDYTEENSCSFTGESFESLGSGFETSAKVTPKMFSPDGDGVEDSVKIKLNAKNTVPISQWKVFVKSESGAELWSKTGSGKIPESVEWDGKTANDEELYSMQILTASLYAVDETGTASDEQKTDNFEVSILLEKNEHGQYKIKVSNIAFQSNGAGFDGITQEQSKRNEKTLAYIAQALKKYSDYKVLIVGHANPTTKNPREETQDGTWGRALIPLSKERAQFIKQKLVSLGIEESRLDVDGKGGLETVADPFDAENKWKNRRVEFILER